MAPAAHAAGVGVTSLSSLAAGAKAGNLTGVVTNDGDSAATARVSVRVMRRGTGGALIGTTAVDVAAHGTKSFLVDVKLPSLKKGTYYVAACTPQGGSDTGKLGCATSAADLKIKGGDPLQGKLATKAFETQNGAAQGARRRRHRPAAPARARSPSRATASGRSSATAATSRCTPTSSRSMTRSRTSSCRATASSSRSSRRSA